MAVKKKSKKKRRKKKQVPALHQSKVNIRVVGIGGGGTSIASEMTNKLRGVSFVLADSDGRVFKKAKGSRKVKIFQFGQDMLGGAGTGMNPERAQKAALAEKERIAKLFERQDLSIIIGCLGGGVASGAGPVFANSARKKKNISLGIFLLPFQFEGEKKMKIAKKAITKLADDLSAMVVVSNEKIFRITDKKTPLKKAFSSLNQIFADWLVELIDVISRPSLINIDFADLKTILKERGDRLFFGQAKAQGPNRAEEIVKGLFHHPLFEQKPDGAGRILFNITGGNDLKIREVALISQSIADLNPKAKIVFGISQSPSYKGKIKLTLMALTGKDKREHEERARETKKRGGGKRKPSSVGADKKTKPDKKTVNKEQETKEKATKDKGKAKKIRRSALEVKAAEKEEEEREWAGERGWEVPAFLRGK